MSVGISEETDVFVIVVSEETGTISIAEKGNLTRFLNREALASHLVYKEQHHEHQHWRKNMSAYPHYITDVRCQYSA